VALYNPARCAIMSSPEASVGVGRSWRSSPRSASSSSA